MDNTKLERKANRVNDEIQDVIRDLIIEIETLEGIIINLNNIITKYAETIENLLLEKLNTK